MDLEVSDYLFGETEIKAEDMKFPKSFQEDIFAFIQEMLYRDWQIFRQFAQGLSPVRSFVNLRLKSLSNSFHPVLDYRYISFIPLKYYEVFIIHNQCDLMFHYRYALYFKEVR